MKKGIIISGILLIILMLLIIILSSKKEAKNDDLKIVTSFYPTYIITKNITKDVANVEVINIVNSFTGCIHDYSLTPSDMVKIEAANILIVNGAGMESFITRIKDEYSSLPIIDSAINIDLLTAAHNHHDEDDHEEDHDEEYNTHLWMDPEKYIKQINNISMKLIEIDPVNKNKYQENTEAYIEKVEMVIERITTELNILKDHKVIIFHDALVYLANYIGLDIVHTVNIDHDETLSAAQIDEIINEIKEHNVKTILIEKQFSNGIIDTIKKEVVVDVYTIDTAVTGNNDIDSYLEAMNQNIEVLKGVFND